MPSPDPNPPENNDGCCIKLSPAYDRGDTYILALAVRSRCLGWPTTLVQACVYKSSGATIGREVAPVWKHFHQRILQIHVATWARSAMQKVWLREVLELHVSEMAIGIKWHYMYAPNVSRQ